MELPLFIQVLLLICLCHQVESTCNPTLESTPPGGSTLYNNQPISVTCTTTSSQLLTWQSKEYIGPGHHVSVSSSDELGTTIPVNTDLEVTALVISTSNTPGEEMIESLLKINVTSTYPNFTITCRNYDLGTTASVTYQTIDKNAIELTSVDQPVCPGEEVHLNCTGLDTDLIQWDVKIAGNDAQTFHCREDDPALRNEILNGMPIVLDKHYSDIPQILTCGITLPDLPICIGEQLWFGCYNHAVGVRDSTTIQLATTVICKSTTTQSAEDVHIPQTAADNSTEAKNCASKFSAVVKIALAVAACVCIII